MLLFIDTETTGMVRRELAIDHVLQPRMVQVAAILAADDGESIAEMSCIVKPDGWQVEAGAEAVHGFSTEKCASCGVPVVDVLGLLSSMCLIAEKIVAHNVEFDSRIVKSEFLRVLGRPVIDQHALHCTMLEATPIVRIPSPRRFGEFKWPKLSEAYKHFLGTDLTNAHDAMADVRACKDIYFAIRKVAV